MSELKHALAINLLNPIPKNEFYNIGKGNAIFNDNEEDNIKVFWKLNYVKDGNYCIKWRRWKSIMDYTKINYKDGTTVMTDDIYHFISKEAFNNLTKALLPIFNNIYSETFSEDTHFVEKIGFNNINKYNKIISSDSRIILIGDIHSSFHSLLQVIETLVNRNFFQKNDEGETILKLKPKHYIFFLGDMLDRGPYNIEVLYLCFILQYLNIDIKNSTRQVWLLNGNHEDFIINRQISDNTSPMGYAEELREQFNLSITDEYIDYYKILHYLPSAIFLKFTEKIYQLNHGAIDLSQITKIIDIQYLDDLLKGDKNRMIIKEFSDICFKWYDFNNETDNFKFNNEIIINIDNMSSLEDLDDDYSSRVPIPKNILNIYLQKFNIEAVISGHQDNTSIGIVENNIKLSGGAAQTLRDNLINDGYYGDKLRTVKENSKKNKETNIIILEPKEDFLALTTSLATVSKGVFKTTFLELYKRDNDLQSNFKKKLLEIKKSIKDKSINEEEYNKNIEEDIKINQNIYYYDPYHSESFGSKALYKISYIDYTEIKDQISAKIKFYHPL